jgi:hypothetical protein
MQENVKSWIVESSVFQQTLSLLCTVLVVGRSRDRFPVVALGIFSVDTDRTMCPGVDPASKNEYQGFLLG